MVHNDSVYTCGYAASCRLDEVVLRLRLIRVLRLYYSLQAGFKFRADQEMKLVHS